MTAPIKKALDVAVSRKAITAAQEKQMLSRYESALSQRINQKGGLALPRAFFRGQGPNGTRIPRSAWPAPGGQATPATGQPPGALPQLFQPAPTA